MESGPLASAPGDVLRVGVVGGGLVAQAVHLPLLSELCSLYRLTALAEPDAATREALVRRYGIRRGFADHRDLLQGDAVDAVVVSSPNGTHATVVLDALDAGVHVLVEKPLCIALADADRIVAARDRAGLVVQVGYMKRFDPAYEALLDGLPADPRTLRHVTTATYDPGLGAWFSPADTRSRESRHGAVDELARRTADQVGDATGSDADDDVEVFSEVFLGALVHDVNAVHGVLERLGTAPPDVVLDAFGDELGCGATVRLTGGARWTMAWLRLDGLADFREELVLYGGDGLRRLEFPAPYIRGAPTAYTRSTGDDRGNASLTFRSWHGSYERELVHFHACVTGQVACRTPPEQARLDIELITELFRMRAGVPA